MAYEQDVKGRDPSLPIVSGVYFLFREGALDYVGQSKDCHARIATHRSNGREFDLATVMPLRQEFMTQVETALIKAYAPRKNVSQKPAAERAAWVEPSRVEKKVRAPVMPGPLGTVSRGKAREMAVFHGIGAAKIDEAIAAGRLRFVPSLRTGSAGKPVPVALYSEVEAFCVAEQARQLAQIGLSQQASTTLLGDVSPAFKPGRHHQLVDSIEIHLLAPAC